MLKFISGHNLNFDFSFRWRETQCAWMCFPKNFNLQLNLNIKSKKEKHFVESWRSRPLRGFKIELLWHCGCFCCFKQSPEELVEQFPFGSLLKLSWVIPIYFNIKIWDELHGFSACYFYSLFFIMPINSCLESRSSFSYWPILSGIHHFTMYAKNLSLH